MDTLEYAIKHGYPQLLQESKENALYQDPVRVFRMASEHSHVDLACMVAERLLKFRPTSYNGFDSARPHNDSVPVTFEMGAMAFQTDHIFSILKFAVEHKLEHLIELAASVSAENPKFALAVDELNYETLAAWVSQNN